VGGCRCGEGPVSPSPPTQPVGFCGRRKEAGAVSWVPTEEPEKLVGKSEYPSVDPVEGYSYSP
jgi:hypothetical protein